MNFREFTIKLHTYSDGSFSLRSRDINLRILSRILSNGVLEDIYHIDEDIIHKDIGVVVKKGPVSVYLGYESAIYLDDLFLNKKEHKYESI